MIIKSIPLAPGGLLWLPHGFMVRAATLKPRVQVHIEIPNGLSLVPFAVLERHHCDEVPVGAIYLCTVPGKRRLSLRDLLLPAEYRPEAPVRHFYLTEVRT